VVAGVYQRLDTDSFPQIGQRPAANDRYRPTIRDGKASEKETSFRRHGHTGGFVRDRHECSIKVQKEKPAMEGSEARSDLVKMSQKRPGFMRSASTHLLKLPAI
jgi:hypothetical protein